MLVWGGIVEMVVRNVVASVYVLVLISDYRTVFRTAVSGSHDPEMEGRTPSV